jgi:hypothetical protein
LRWTRRPELERSWGDPPSELGPLLPPCGAGAGSVWGGGFGTDGVVGVVGVVGVGGAGAGTGVPGSWMSSSELPGGTSTCTGTTSPEGSWT